MKYTLFFNLTLFSNLISLYPTYGGSNPGVQAEITHSLKKELNLICGCALARHSSAFASLSVSWFRYCVNLKFDTLLATIAAFSMFLLLIRNELLRMSAK